MNDKFYSELITEQLYSNITAIKEANHIGDCFNRKVGQFTFIFINSKKYTCKCIEEKELETTIVEHDNFTNIVVFVNTHSNRSGYWNHHIIFIGIFDMIGNKSTRKFDSIRLNSITTGCIGFGYDTEEIKSCNITILENPFKNYLRKGSQVAIDGRIQTSSYEKDGVRRYNTDVVANNVQFLDTKNSGNAGGNDNFEFDNVSPSDFSSSMSTTTVKNDPFADFGASIEINDDELPF